MVSAEFSKGRAYATFVTAARTLAVRGPGLSTTGRKFVSSLVRASCNFLDTQSLLKTTLWAKVRVLLRGSAKTSLYAKYKN
jgi:hypothetical protein